LILYLTEDYNDSLQSFHYPTLELDLPINSWNEYWRKKQENDKSTNHDKDETINNTLKSNELDATANETLKSDGGNILKMIGKGNEALVKAMKAEGPFSVKYE
jgi:hypothetical protein